MLKRNSESRFFIYYEAKTDQYKNIKKVITAAQTCELKLLEITYTRT